MTTHFLDEKLTRKGRWSLAVLVCYFLIPDSAEAKSVRLDLFSIPESSRWAYSPQGKPNALGLMKQDALMGRAQTCAERGERLLRSYPILQMHIQRQRLDCIVDWIQEDRRAFDDLKELLAIFEGHPSWRIAGPMAPLVRKTYARARLFYLRELIKRDRGRAWSSIEELKSIRDDLSLADRALFYRLAGELDFIEQKFLMSIQFYEQSLELDADDEIKKKLVSLKRQLLKPERQSVVQRAKLKPIGLNLQAVPEESKLLKQMQNAVALGDLLPAVEDGVRIIQRFSGSASADWAFEKISEIFLSLIEQKSENFHLMKQRVLEQILTVDPDRKLEWAQRAFWKMQYREAILLGDSAAEGMGGRKDQKDALMIVARSAQFLGDLKKAKEYFEKLNALFAGSAISHQALFQLGLIELRIGEFSPASARFERVVAITDNEDLQLKALYWQWRAAQQLNQDRATETWNRLVNSYPLSFYGLVARAEANQGQLGFAESHRSPGLQIEQTRLEESIRQRFSLLVAGGWLEEARLELSGLFLGNSPVDHLVRASEWAAALDYGRAIPLLENYWASNILNISLTSLKIAYSKEYQQFVQVAGRKAGIAPEWLWAIMKEKSQFDATKVSEDGRVGLMQIPFSVASLVAKEKMNKKTLTRAQLLAVGLNLELAAHHLKDLLVRAEGDLLQALVAYRVGEERFNTWRAFRESANPASKEDPFGLVWIDELPWHEDADRVKRVLRNILIYQILDQGTVQVEPYFWRSSST